MWTGTIWMKYIFIVMQQHLKLQGQLPKNWDFLKVIVKYCYNLLKFGKSEFFYYI